MTGAVAWPRTTSRCSSGSASWAMVLQNGARVPELDEVDAARS